MKKKTKIVKVASKWTLDEGLEEALKRAENEIEAIDYIFDETNKRSREGYRLNSKGVRIKLRANNETRKRKKAEHTASVKKQKEEAERKQRRANWRKLKGLD